MRLMTSTVRGSLFYRDNTQDQLQQVARKCVADRVHTSVGVTCDKTLVAEVVAIDARRTRHLK